MMEAIIYKGENLYLEESNRRLVIDKILLDIDFELIEDTINSIKELYIGEKTTEERLKINEIIRKVNQLEKQLKENMQ